MSIHAFHRDLPVPPGANHLCQAERVIRVGFVDLKAERSLGVPGVHADNRHPRRRRLSVSQLESCPVSRPTRTAPGACWRTIAVIVSGSEEHFPRQMIAPASSTTQIEVVSSETSRPT